MNKGLLAICDSEEKFLYRLQELLEERDTFPFQIAIYSDIDALNRLISKGTVDVLLIEDKLYERVEAHQDTLIILLDTGMGSMDIPTIWKFQSGDAIRKELLKAYSNHKSEDGEIRSSGTSIHVNRKRETIFIGVYSPIGRCLQTSFSVLLGKQLAARGPVLYLNFEPFSGLEKTLSYDSDKDLTDLVYFLRGGSERLIYKLEGMTCRMGSLDYIAPASSFTDLCQVEESDWLTLVTTLKKNSNYEYVILDLSEMVTGLLNVLRQCAIIYTITKSDGRARAKLDQYEALLKELEYDDVISKTRKKEFPIFKNLPEDLQNLEYSELAQFVKDMVKDDFADEL